MTAKYDLNQKALSCFICGKLVESTDYPILPGELENSQTSLLPRINQIIGKALVALMSDKEYLCQKCGTLMDLMNDLESKLDDVKSTLATLLNRKFKDILDTSKELGGECSEIESCNSGTSGNKLCEKSQDNICALKFSKEDSIVMVEEENSIPYLKSMKYRCKFCSFSSHSVECLNVHISSKHKEFMCSICHEVFVSLDKVHSHIKESHLAKWTCQFCDKIFSSKVPYVNHTKLHLKGLSEESINQIEKEKGNLSANIKEEFSENYVSKIKAKNHQCSFCEYTTDSKNLFDDHIRSHVVLKLKLIKCEVCGLLFESKALLNEHEKSHKKVVFRCGICENTFQSREFVIRHLNEKHKQHHSAEKSDLRPFRRRKQMYNNLLTDLSVNSEIVKSSSVGFHSSSKKNDFMRCDTNSSEIDGIVLDKRENLDVALSEDFSCVVQSNIVEEKENSRDSTNFSQGIINESFSEKVQANLEKTFLKSQTACQIQDCQSKIVDSPTTSLFGTIKNSGTERHFPNSSRHRKEDNSTDGLETCLVPAFENVVDSGVDELELNSLLLTGNGYLDSLILRSRKEIVRIDGSKLNDVHFKSIKVKASAFKEGLTSEVKLTEEYLDSETESEPLWISLNSLAGNENVNCAIRAKQSAEPAKPSKIFVCGKCGYKSVTAVGIKDHFATHGISKSDVGQLDGEEMIDALNCSQHASGASEKQTRVQKLACSHCAWESPDKLQLRNHINEFHSNAKADFTCWYCKKRCATKLQLIHHEKIHGRNKIYRCKVCSKGFTRENLLNKHKRIAHSSSKCCFCTKTFLNADDLSKHKAKHEHADGFQCLDCPRIFKTKTGLKFHSAQHTGEYKFRCQYCDQGFMSRVVYQEHMGKHTKEERYVCDVCGRKFCFQSTYWIHRKWHDTPFPYKCDICERPFRHSSLLKVHKRQHTGERPYNCPHCPRSFSVSGTLKRHLMLHTGEYAFNCGECEKGFTTRNKFALHLSRVHGNDSMLQQGPPKTEFKMVIRDSPKATEGEVHGEDMVVESYEELDSMMVQDGGIVGDGAELLKESSLMLPCTILDDVGGDLETRVVEILVNDETSQAVATVTVEGNSSLVSW